MHGSETAGEGGTPGPGVPVAGALWKAVGSRRPGSKVAPPPETRRAWRKGEKTIMKQSFRSVCLLAGAALAAAQDPDSPSLSSDGTGISAELPVSLCTITSDCVLRTR